MGGTLFVHGNFPGQLGFVAAELARRRQPVAAVGGATARALPGIPLSQWALRQGTTPGVHKLAQQPELDLMSGRAAAQAALEHKKRGFEPDVIVAHPIVGGGLFMKEVYPDARLIVHAEYYYRPTGGDGDFDPEFRIDNFEQQIKVQAMNASLALTYTRADCLVSPTPFQKGVLPRIFQDKTVVIHEGVDTDATARKPNPLWRLPSGHVLDPTRPVITYVSRRFEPMRGFHIFLRALPRLLAEVPEASILIVGSEERGGYGIQAPVGTTWKQYLLEQMGERLDLDRVHFTGPLPREAMIEVLSLSTAHVYLTYPFVLSWSLLDAMACECLVIASDTASVRDVVRHGVNGLLTDFFDVDALSEAMVGACRSPSAFLPLRKAARATVLEGFDRRRRCLPAWLALIESQAVERERIGR